MKKCRSTLNKTYEEIYGKNKAKQMKKQRSQCWKKSYEERWGTNIAANAKQKLSEYGKKRIGNKNPFYGKKHSQQTKNQISKLRAGKYAGSLNPNWHGGRFLDKKHGYNYVRIGNKYQYEHRAQIEKALGRPLEKNEPVHHIDGNKLNNNIANLYLCNNRREHRKIHMQLERLALKLVRLGMIRFNKNIGEYEAII